MYVMETGVVVIYPRGDWFGFITEEQVERLLDNYIEHGALVPEFWRGRMVPAAPLEPSTCPT